MTDWICDATALASFRESPELFRLRHRLHLVPAQPDDKLRAGSAIHAGLDALRRGQGVEEAVRVTRAVRGEAPGQRDASQCERIVRAYATRYPREAEPFRVVATEEYAEAWIAVPQPPHGDMDGFRWCGIRDAVVEFPDGSRYVMDTKSTGAPLGAAWEEAMRLSDQLTGYVAMERALGRRCDGYVVDAIHVSDYVPKSTPGAGPKVDALKDFARVGPVHVPAWRCERWARDVAYTLREIERLEAERGIGEPWPMYQNWPYGKVGPYAPLFEAADEAMPHVMALFAVETWEPRRVAEERAEAGAQAVAP
jgi:hypothetical protein